MDALSSSNRPSEGRRPPLSPGTFIDDYELVDVIGEGSFAVVWEARHRSLERVAAVKILRKRSDRDTGRFLREAQLGARLRHPYIVQVYDYGHSQALDAHYLATELIEGVSLGEWDRFNKLDPHEIAALLQKVARALHYAHEQGVIHRDLKPENVIVDLRGDPHITDFGLARDLHQRMTETNLTIGTVAYMSPEQARGESDSADARSDVYSVGVILFEFLTGDLPFAAGSLPKYLAALANIDAPAPHHVRAGIPADLSMICSKCLRSSSKDRYGNAAELADDLNRFLRGVPVSARPLPIALRLVRWSALNRWATVAILLLSVISIVSPAMVLYENRQRTQLLEQQRELRSRQYASDLFRGFQHRERGELRELKATLARHMPSLGQEDLRDYEWFLLDEWLQKRQRVIGEAGEPLYALADLGAREEIAAVGHSGRVFVWNAKTGTLVRTLGPARGATYALAASVDGRQLFVPGEEPGLLECYDAADGRLLERLSLPITKTIESIEVSPDGRMLAVGERHLQVVLVDWPEQKVTCTIPSDGRHESVAFSPDGSHLAIVRDRGVQLWNVRAGQLVVDASTLGKAQSVAWSPSGEEVLIALHSSYHLARVGLDGRQDERALEMRSGQIRYLAMSADGQSLWSGGMDGSLYHLRSSAPGRVGENASLAETAIRPRMISGHAGRVFDLSLRGDGECISVGDDGRLIGTRASDYEAARSWSLPTESDVLEFRPGSKSVVCGGTNGCLYLDGSEVFADDNRSPIGSLEVLDADTVALGLKDGRVLTWSIGDRRLVSAIAFGEDRGLSKISTMLRTSPKGTWFYGVENEVWQSPQDRRSRSARFRWTDATRQLAYWPAEDLLFAGGRYEDVLALDGKSFELKFRLMNASGCNALALDASRGLLVSGHNDSTIRVWDLRSHCERFVMQGHELGVRGLDLHPAGNTLASASLDGTVRLWRLESGLEYGIVGSLPGHEAMRVRFSEDGRALATVFLTPDRQSSEVRVWEVGSR